MDALQTQAKRRIGVRKKGIRELIHKETVQSIRFIAIFFIFMMVFAPLLSPSYAQINNQRKTALASETISFGPLDIQLTYSLNLDITMPKKIITGTTN